MAVQSVDRAELLELLYQKLPQEAQDVINAARANGKRVTLVDQFPTAQRLFEAAPGKPNQVCYRDLQGNEIHEFTVEVKTNGVSLTFTDEGNAARPAGDAFFMGTRGDYSKPYLPDVVDCTPEELRKDAEDWLTGNYSIDGNDGLAVILASVGGYDGVIIVPARSAWAYLAFRLIHEVRTLEECLEQGFDPKFLLLNAPGIRCRLDGRHCSIFYPDDDKQFMTIISLSSYMGIGLSKKAMFMFLSWVLAKEGGMINHGTLSRTELGGESVDCLYIARSGCGKTEWRLPVPTDSDGKCLLGQSDEFGEVWIDYPSANHPEVICGGDDLAVTPRLETTPDGLGRAQNGEPGGVFDRTTGDDVDLNRKIFEKARPDTMLALSYEQRDGKPLAVEHLAKVGSRNPRQTYPWALLGELGVKYTIKEIPYEHRIYGIGLMPSEAAWSWANRMPPILGFIHRYVGWCRAKSRSITGSQKECMIADWAATVGGFSPLSMVEQANLFWRETVAFHKVKDWVVPTGFVGKFTLPTEFEAEQFFRDFLVHVKAGNASWELIPAESPIFGYRPDNVRFFGQEIPKFFCAPVLQWGEQSYFEIAERYHQEYLRVLEPLMNDPRLSTGARKAMMLFAQLRSDGYTSEELWAIQERFEMLAV